MGALLGLGVGVGLMLVWSAFFVPRRSRRATRSTGQVGRLLARAGLGDVAPSGHRRLCSDLRANGVGRPGDLPNATGGRRLRPHRRLPTGGSTRRTCPSSATGVRRGLAGSCRQPGFGGPGRPVAARGALRARGARTGPLRPAFDAFALDFQVTSRFSESLDRLKERLADPVGDRAVEGLRIAREVGGGELGRLLRNLSGYLRDEARIRSELDGAAGLGCQRSPVGRGRPLGRAALDVRAVGCDPSLRLAGRHGRPRDRSRHLSGRLPGNDAHRPAARRERRMPVDTVALVV